MQHHRSLSCVTPVALVLVLVGLAPPAKAQVFQAGNADGLAAPADPVAPSAALLALLAANAGTRNYDLAAGINGGFSDTQVAHTFTGLPSNIGAATLEISIRAGTCCGTDNDGLLLSFVDSSATNYVNELVYARPFGPYSGPGVFPTPDGTGLLGGWSNGASATFTVDLANLPLADGSTLNLLPQLAANRFIDVNVSDDTAVDYVRLTVLNCNAWTYCTAKTSSSGCSPAIDATGAPSLANANAFVITTTSVEHAKSGLTFFGTSGAIATPFQGGLLCVTSPLFRLSLKNSGGASACGGSLSYTLQEFLDHSTGGASLTAGTLVHAQTWFRDPATMSTTGLSNGLRFHICP